MTKLEYVKSFIEKIQNNQFDELYKYFTSRTVIVDLDDFKEYDVSSFLEYLDSTFKEKEIKLGRILESSVCVKVEITSTLFNHSSMLFEVKDRRFSRVEVF